MTSDSGDRLVFGDFNCRENVPLFNSDGTPPLPKKHQNSDFDLKPKNTPRMKFCVDSKSGVRSAISRLFLRKIAEKIADFFEKSPKMAENGRKRADLSK